MKSLVVDSKPSETLLRGEPVHRTLPRVNRRTQWGLLVSALIIIDFATTAVAFRAAHLLRFDLELGIFQTDLGQRELFYEVLVGALLLAWLVTFAWMGLYDHQILLGGTEEYARVFRACTYCLLLVIIAGFLWPELIIARGWIILAWLFTFLFVSLGRMA